MKAAATPDPMVDSTAKAQQKDITLQKSHSVAKVKTEQPIQQLEESNYSNSGFDNDSVPMKSVGGKSKQE